MIGKCISAFSLNLRETRNSSFHHRTTGLQGSNNDIPPSAVLPCHTTALLLKQRPLSGHRSRHPDPEIHLPCHRLHSISPPATGAPPHNPLSASPPIKRRPFKCAARRQKRTALWGAVSRFLRKPRVMLWDGVHRGRG